VLPFFKAKIEADLDIEEVYRLNFETGFVLLELVSGLGLSRRAALLKDNKCPRVAAA
jgi:hypothetical protein